MDHRSISRSTDPEYLRVEVVAILGLSVALWGPVVLWAVGA